MRICVILLGAGYICSSRLLPKNGPLHCHRVCQGWGKPAESQEMRLISSSGLYFLPGFKAVL